MTDPKFPNHDDSVASEEGAELSGAELREAINQNLHYLQEILHAKNLLRQLELTRRYSPGAAEVMQQRIKQWRAHHDQYYVSAEDLIEIRQAVAGLRNEYEHVTKESRGTYDTEFQALHVTLTTVCDELRVKKIFFEDEAFRQRMDRHRLRVIGRNAQDCNAIEITLNDLTKRGELFEKNLRNPLFSTEDGRRAFASIDAFDFSDRRSLARVQTKQAIVEEVIQQQLLDQELFQQYACVYIGSGTDVEFPLSFGARNIILVDARFSDLRLRAEVRERIECVIQQQPTKVSEHELRFMVDFGNGDEEVTVVMDHRFYGSAEQVAELSRTSGYPLQRFVPPEHIALLMSYKAGNVRLTADAQTTASIVSRGALLTDDRLENDREQYLQDVYHSVELESQRDNFHFTFLKKQ